MIRYDSKHLSGNNNVSVKMGDFWNIILKST